MAGRRMINPVKEGSNPALDQGLEPEPDANAARHESGEGAGSNDVEVLPSEHVDSGHDDKKRLPSEKLPSEKKAPD